MPKAGRNVYKRKDGRWEGRYRTQSNGTVKYVSVYGKTYHELREKLMTAQIDQHTDEPESTEMIFADVLQLWLSNNRPRLKASSEWKYQYLIRTHILPELGNLRLTDLSSTVVNNFLNQKLAYGKLNTSGGLSTSYTATLMWIIHAALHFAVQEQYCPPVKYTISKLQKTDQEQIVLSREEQAAFEKKLILNPTPTKMGILLSLNTGLRIGEVCALQWDDLDFKNNILHAKNVVRDQLAKASAKSRINKLTGRLAEKTSEFWKTSGKYTLNKVVVGLYSIVEGEVYKRKLKKWVTGEMDEYYHCELAA